MRKYMMATKAIHQLGDISSEIPDLCFIHSEDEENYIGNWVIGVFTNVKFPKETTRELIKDEINYWNSVTLRIGSQPSYKLKVD